MEPTNFRGQVSQDIMPQKIDAIDRKILYMLSQNCRISNTAIAKALKIKREVVAYRIKQLLERKVINGFFAHIDSRKLGFITHQVYLKLRSVSDEKKIIQYLLPKKEVTCVLTFSGKYDLFFTDNRNIVFTLAGNSTGITAGTCIKINGHTPLVSFFITVFIP